MFLGVQAGEQKLLFVFYVPRFHMKEMTHEGDERERERRKGFLARWGRRLLWGAQEGIKRISRLMKGSQLNRVSLFQ